MADDQTFQSVGMIIPEGVVERFPELVEMLRKTSTIPIDEKNYWLQMLPVMDEGQISELRTILVDDQTKAAEITAEAEQRTNAAIAEAEMAAKAIADRKKREAIHIAEAANRKREAENAEDLLSTLDEA